jgi:hypothetical protein
LDNKQEDDMNIELVQDGRQTIYSILSHNAIQFFLGGSGKTTKILLTGGHHGCILNLLIPDGNHEP